MQVNAGRSDLNSTPLELNPFLSDFSEQTIESWKPQKDLPSRRKVCEVASTIRIEFLLLRKFGSDYQHLETRIKLYVS
jgi:hypothetical protein